MAPAGSNRKTTKWEKKDDEEWKDRSMRSSFGVSLKRIAFGRKIFIGFVLIGAVVQFVTFYRETQRTAAEAKGREIAIALVQRRFQTIYSECEDNSNTDRDDRDCWEVADLVSVRRRRKNESQGADDEMNRLIGERLLVKSASSRWFIFSKMNLIVPKPLTSESTKDWDLNTIQLSSSYLHAAILIPLTTGHLHLDAGSPITTKEMVLIGIGGGTFSVYLQSQVHNWRILSIELDARVVSLARQFFGLRDEENPRETVQVGDGLAWIEETAAKGKQVDVIYMDANNEHAKEGFISPLPALINENSGLVAKLAAIIRPEGIYFSNVITANINETARLQQWILRRYGRHFAHCLIVDYGRADFQLACSHSSVLDVKSSVDRKSDFLTTAKNWYRRLGFDSSLESILQVITAA